MSVLRFARVQNENIKALHPFLQGWGALCLMGSGGKKSAVRVSGVQPPHAMAQMRDLLPDLFWRKRFEQIAAAMQLQRVCHIF